MPDKVRVGIVGAGQNTRLRHIPGLRALPDVEIVGVVNQSKASSQKAAEEFQIPRVFDSWEELVADPEIDAVVIGTWPNLHQPITCSALEAGKHVLTEARMARDLAEARQMLEAAQAHPELVAQVVPSPFGLKCGPVVKDLLDSHFLGDLREVVVLGANNQFWDYSQHIHPRQLSELSGKNALALGILHETLMRWVPPPVQVFAQSELFEPTRPDVEQNSFREVTVPDSLQILTEFKGGIRGIYHLSGVILFGPGLQIHLYGSRGTLKMEFLNDEERVYSGRADDKELQLLDIPVEDQGQWQVEEDFIAAIRGERKVTLNSFETGVAYMEFVEAVAQSAETNLPCQLPLE